MPEGYDTHFLKLWGYLTTLEEPDEMCYLPLWTVRVLNYCGQKPGYTVHHLTRRMSFGHFSELMSRVVTHRRGKKGSYSILGIKPMTFDRSMYLKSHSMSIHGVMALNNNDR